MNRADRISGWILSILVAAMLAILAFTLSGCAALSLVIHPTSSIISLLKPVFRNPAIKKPTPGLPVRP